MRKLNVQSRFSHHFLELISGASIALIVKLLGAGISFTFNIILARRLGADGTGIYLLALNVITIAVIFGRLGLDRSVLQLVSAKASIHDWKVVAGIKQQSFRIAFSSSLIATTIVFLLAPWLSFVLFKEEATLPAIRWMSFAILPMTFVFLMADMLKSIKKILNATLIEAVGVVGLALIFFLIFGKFYGIAGAVWSYVIASIITAILGVVFWEKSTPELVNVKGYFSRKQIMSTSIPFFWIALTNWLVNRFGDIGLGIWGTNADVGIFGIASRTALFVSFSLLAVNSIAAPKFSSLYHQGDIKTLEATVRNAIKLTIITSSPVFLFCILFPGWVMGLFGSEFITGAHILIVLVSAQFVNAATGPVELLLMMSGNERLVRNNVLIFGAFTILLTVSLVPRYGALGAAIAFATTLILKNLVSVWLVRKKLSISLYAL